MLPGSINAAWCAGPGLDPCSEAGQLRVREGLEQGAPCDRLRDDVALNGDLGVALEAVLLDERQVPPALGVRVALAVLDHGLVVPGHLLRPIEAPAFWGRGATRLGDAPLPLAMCGRGARAADNADAVEEARNLVRRLRALAEPEDAAVGLHLHGPGVVHVPEGVPPAEVFEVAAGFVLLLGLEGRLDPVEGGLARAPTVQADAEPGQPLLAKDVAVVGLVLRAALPRSLHLDDRPKRGEAVRG
mmetsp:Transcript_17449/g.55239  ORF Transcript_17449/g.55239 Transcript_17449/m.55239 type:complete len:244 (-) Transcript_17449:269-1000(-)